MTIKRATSTTGPDYTTKNLNNDILSAIISNKRKEIELQMEVISIQQLENIITNRDEDINTGKNTDLHNPIHKSLSKSIITSPTGIIAEFKRRSPSKGWINKGADIASVIEGYSKAGASGISLLTDEKFFGGNIKDLIEAKKNTDIPVLRKDFIISEYQIYQAKAVNADAVLLIAAALTKNECKALAHKAHELGLEVLLELHSEKELEYLGGDTTDNIDLIGINNRNLGSFHTDIENSFRLIGKLPEGYPLISESGISDAEDILHLKSVGFNGFLMGESFMRNDSPHQSLAMLIEKLTANN